MRIVNVAIAFSVLAFLSVCVLATVPVILVFRAVLTSQLKKDSAIGRIHTATRAI